MSKKFGFTLAEVLITLGIIGVVAAMTMPTLLANTQGAQFKTAFKKELSTMNQAVLMQFAMEDTDFSNLIADEGTDPNPQVSDSGITMSGILTSRLQAATNITDEYTDVGAVDYSLQHSCTAAEVAEDDPESANYIEGCSGGTEGEVVEITMSKTIGAGNFWAYSFADGTAFIFNKSAHECTSLGVVEENGCYGYLDVNGITKPNQVTSCDDVEDGTATKCEPSEIHDIFPVIFYGQTMEPGTKSARAVLTNK